MQLLRNLDTGQRCDSTARSQIGSQIIGPDPNPVQRELSWRVVLTQVSKAANC